MDEILNSVNAEPEVTVEPQTTNEEVQTTGESVNSEPAAQKPVQDAQTNAQFAEMRRRNEKLQRDYEISKQYGQYGIHTEEDYQAALAEQEAQRMAENPQLLYNKLNTLEQKVTGYEEREKALARKETLLNQEKQLESDPEVGDLYKQWKGEVKQLADNANVDYETAFSYMLRRNVGQILNSTKTAGQQEAIRSITNNAQTSPGALSAGAGNVKPSVYSMSKADFRKMQEEVMRGERKTL